MRVPPTMTRARTEGIAVATATDFCYVSPIYLPRLVVSALSA